MQAAHRLHDIEADRPALTLIEGGASFREQLEACLPQLFPRALHLARHPDSARDLVQDTMLRALRFEDTFMPGSNMRAWLSQVLYSVFVSQCRRRRRERVVTDDICSDPSVWVHRDAGPQLTGFTRGMQRCLQELPESFAQVLLLVDVEELPYKEAAEYIGVPVGTVMSRLHRARRMLRDRLQHEAA